MQKRKSLSLNNKLLMRQLNNTNYFYVFNSEEVQGATGKPPANICKINIYDYLIAKVITVVVGTLEVIDLLWVKDVDPLRDLGKMSVFTKEVHKVIAVQRGGLQSYDDLAEGMIFYC